jgi:hypothetical protein
LGAGAITADGRFASDCELTSFHVVVLVAGCLSRRGCLDGTTHAVVESGYSLKAF